MINRFIDESIYNIDQGRSVKFKKKRATPIPAVLKSAIENDKTLKDAFHLLTSGRQREYVEYIDEAKREETKLKRLRKITPLIKEGTGLRDRYRSK